MKTKRRLRAAGALILCLSLLTGCTGAERIRTVVLPDPIKVQETEEEREDSYQVKKIYTWEYAAPAPQSASLLECGEHEIRLASVAKDGSGIRFDRLDYRYGFYEAYGRADMERLAMYDLADGDEKQFQKNALSPNGRFFLWKDQEGKDGSLNICLTDMETGEEEILPNEEDTEHPGDEYFPLAAWSRDGKYLAYCFFPKTEETYESGREPVIVILHAETKTIVGKCAYNKAAGESMPRLDETALYLDVADGEALVVAASSQEKDSRIRLEICNMEIAGKSDQEIFQNYASSFADPRATIYPDVKTDAIYVEEDFGLVYKIDRMTGSYGEDTLLKQNPENGNIQEDGEVPDLQGILEFLVLDEGETVIGTEKAKTGQDICIYQKKNETWEKKILYHYNAGALYFLQYDEVHHRLLAISSAFYIYGVNQTAIILEFS